MISTCLFTLTALAAFLPLCQAFHPVELDVWVPRILDPHEGTVWHAGDHQTVTWDINDAPVEITNPLGRIYLVSNNEILLSDPLASDFNLLDGRVEIEVPSVSSGEYQIVLFGDSGNDSPVFRIIS